MNEKKKKHQKTKQNREEDGRDRAERCKRKPKTGPLCLHSTIWVTLDKWMGSRMKTQVLNLQVENTKYNISA